MTAPTGVGPCGKREGAGRPFGSTNHRSRALVVEAVRNGDLMPLDYLLATMRDNTASHRERLQAAAIAAPFCHPRLTAQVTAYIDPAKLSDDELLRTLRQLEAQVGEEPLPLPPVNDQPGAVVRPVEEHLPLHRPGSEPPPPPPEPVGTRHLLYDPRAAKMVSRSS
jgi:hypothetical protein